MRQPAVNASARPGMRSRTHLGVDYKGLNARAKTLIEIVYRMRYGGAYPSAAWVKCRECVSVGLYEINANFLPLTPSVSDFALAVKSHAPTDMSCAVGGPHLALAYNPMQRAIHFIRRSGFAIDYVKRGRPGACKRRVEYRQPPRSSARCGASSHYRWWLYQNGTPRL